MDLHRLELEKNLRPEVDKGTGGARKFAALKTYTAVFASPTAATGARGATATIDVTGARGVTATTDATAARDATGTPAATATLNVPATSAATPPTATVPTVLAAFPGLRTLSAFVLFVLFTFSSVIFPGASPVVLASEPLADVGPVEEGAEAEQGAGGERSEQDTERERGQQGEDGERGEESLHSLIVEAVWEREHAGGSVGLEVVPRPGMTLNLTLGVDGFLEKGDQLTASVLRASWRQGFSWGRHGLELEIGKTAQRLGRGRIDTLLMSGELPGYPQIAYSVRGPKYQYDKLIGDLGTADRPYKRLAAHRLTYELTPAFSVGLGEVAVRSEPYPGDIFYDVLPGIPLYLAKYVPGAPSAKDNHLIYLDAEYNAGDWLGYGEVIFNEFPAGLWLSNNPPLFGILVGLEMGPWLAEYSLLTNYAYSNGDPGSRYAHEGRSFGHWMGADGDALEIRWTRDLAPDWRLTLGGFHWRKGEGKVDDWYASRKEREENAFLSGVVERSIGAVAAIAANLDTLVFTAEVRAGIARNFRHQQGQSDYVFAAKAEIAYPF